MAFPEMGGTWAGMGRQVLTPWAYRGHQELWGMGAHLKVGECGMCLHDPNRIGWALGLRGSHWRREDTPLGARRPGFYT